jgi:hypothetical protein
MKALSLGILTLMLAIGADAATISGTVTSDTGAPLSSMTVTAYTTAGVLTASDNTTSSGAYALTVPTGSYHVLAYDPNGTFATSFYAEAESFETSASITVTSTQSVTNINLRLVRSGTIVGRISTTGGASLPNVTVAAYNLSGTRRGFTSTDSAGSFTLALPPGTFKIVAYDDALNYAPTFFDKATSFAAANAVSIASAESATVNIQLPLGAKLTGSITDRATLAALSAMRVTAYAGDGSIAAQSLTGSDGRYAMAARAGALRVVVDDPSGNYATTYALDAESFSTESAVNATAGQMLTTNATMVRGGRLAGRITDRVSGAPLANITATAFNAGGTTRSFANSDAAGAYSIVVPPGDFRVGVFDPALVYLSQFYPNETVFGAATPQHAIAQQSVGGLDFTLPKGARVVAHVTSRTSGAALPAITVGAYDLGGRLLTSAATDGSGNATLLVTPGTIKLVAFDAALQFATSYYLDAPTFEATQALALTEGQSLAASFALIGAGRIHGSVTDAATSAPIAAIQVVAYDASLQTIAETLTNDSGAFQLAVPAGSYVIAAADPAHHYATVFYSGATSPLGATTINVSIGQDIGPFPMHLTAAPIPPRRRAVRH